MGSRRMAWLGAAVMLICLALAGCAGGDDPAAEAVDTSSSDAAEAVETSSASSSSTAPTNETSVTQQTTTTGPASTSSSTTSSSSTAVATTTVATTPPPDPLAGRSLAEICVEEGLTLIAFSYETLQDDFAGTCCVGGGLPADDLECDLDWPFSDVPDCGSYDRMRNAIFARYGFPFQTTQYREMFGARPWYRERADFDPAWLSDEAEANVALLLQLKEDRVGCLP